MVLTGIMYFNIKYGTALTVSLLVFQFLSAPTGATVTGD